jgi:transposase InsO family protein
MFGAGHPHVKPEFFENRGNRDGPRPLIEKSRWVYDAATKKNPRRLPITMATGFCVEAQQEALTLYRKPEIFNTRIRVQFTAASFIETLVDQGVRISMDGKGRYLDNIFNERLWRSLKYAEVDLKTYASVAEARVSIGACVAGVLQRRTFASNARLQNPA